MNLPHILYKFRTKTGLEIAKKLGISTYKFYRLLKSEGLTKPHPFLCRKKEKAKKLLHSYQQALTFCHSMRDLSRELQVSEDTIKFFIKHCGFQSPSKRWVVLKEKGLKRCYTCKKDKPFSEFYKCSFHIDQSLNRLQKVCKDCSKYKMNGRYIENRKRHGFQPYEHANLFPHRIYKAHKAKIPNTEIALRYHTYPLTIKNNILYIERKRASK